MPDQDAVVAEKRRQARPEGADAAADKRRWLEEKAKRQQEDLARTGLDEGKVATSCALYDFPFASRQAACSVPAARHASATK